MKIAVMPKSDIKYLLAHAKRMKNGHILTHLVFCYETIFDAACDPNASTCEFKPEIQAALNAATNGQPQPNTRVESGAQGEGNEILSTTLGTTKDRN